MQCPGCNKEGTKFIEKRVVTLKKYKDKDGVKHMEQTERQNFKAKHSCGWEGEM